jgi:hypothetical protein
VNLKYLLQMDLILQSTRNCKIFWMKQGILLNTRNSKSWLDHVSRNHLKWCWNNWNRFFIQIRALRLVDHYRLLLFFPNLRKWHIKWLMEYRIYTLMYASCSNDRLYATIRCYKHFAQSFTHVSTNKHILNCRPLMGIRSNLSCRLTLYFAVID